MSTDDNSTKSNNSNTSQKCPKNNNTKKADLGLASISYADFIILASTLSYAIAEELNDADLDMLIVFAGMITSDLALLRTKRGILNATSQQKNNVGQEAIIGGTEATNAADVTDIVDISGTSRCNKKRVRKVKKRRKKK